MPVRMTMPRGWRTVHMHRRTRNRTRRRDVPVWAVAMPRAGVAMVMTMRHWRARTAHGRRARSTDGSSHSEADMHPGFCLAAAQGNNQQADGEDSRKKFRFHGLH